MSVCPGIGDICWTSVIQVVTHKLVCFRALGPGNVKVKVKFSRYRPGVAQMVGRDIALFFHDRGTRRGWVVSSTPRPHSTLSKNPIPMYRRLGGPLGRSGLSENLVPTGIRSRAVQLVVSRYTNWATRQGTYCKKLNCLPCLLLLLLLLLLLFPKYNVHNEGKHYQGQIKFPR